MERKLDEYCRHGRWHNWICLILTILNIHKVHQSRRGTALGCATLELFLRRKTFPISPFPEVSKGGHFSHENPRLNPISHFSGQNSIFWSQNVMWEVGNGMWAFKILISSFWFLTSHFLHLTSKSFHSVDFIFLVAIWQLHILIISNVKILI